MKVEQEILVFLFWNDEREYHIPENYASNMLNYFTATFFLGSLLLCLNTLWVMEFPDEQMALLEAEVTHDATCNSQHSQKWVCGGLL